MSWVTVLAKVGLIVSKGALQIATKSHPLVGAVVDVIVSTIATAEEAHGAGAGVVKRSATVEQLKVVIPGLIGLLESISRKDIVKDHVLFTQAAGELIDSIVKLMNSMDLLAPPSEYQVEPEPGTSV
jgi:hypothetical protein